MCFCVCVLVCVHALREKQLIIEFNRRNTVYTERYKAGERETERASGELGGSRGRWFRNREVKNGSLGEMVWELEEQTNEKMQGWRDGWGRDRGSDKEVRWQARPAGCKVMKFCGIFLQAMTPRLTSQSVCCCSRATAQLQWHGLQLFASLNDKA